MTYLRRENWRRDVLVGTDDVSPAHEQSVEEYAQRSLDLLGAGDWYSAYVVASTWANDAGGVWLPDTWLLLSACDVVNGHTRGTVHPLNLGLRDWIDRPGDRVVVRWVRGQLIRTRMNDPAAALTDLLAASAAAPDWLSGRAAASVAAAERAVTTGEDGVPIKHRVTVAPEFAPVEPVDTPLQVRRADGAKPYVFDELLAYFESPPLHAVG